MAKQPGWERSRCHALAVTVLFLGSSAAAVAAEASPPRRDVVFVPAVQGRLSPDTLDLLYDLVIAAIQRADVVDKVTLQDVQAQLQADVVKQRLDCNNESCAAEIAGALNVRYLIATKAQRVGGNLLITVNLVDTKAQKSKTGQAQCTDTSGEYSIAIGAAVRDVLELVRQELERSDDPLYVAARSRTRALWTFGGAALAVGLGGFAAFEAKREGDAYNASADGTGHLGASRTWSGVMWAGAGVAVGLAALGAVFYARGTTPAPVTLVPVAGPESLGIAGRW